MKEAGTCVLILVINFSMLQLNGLVFVFN